MPALDHDGTRAEPLDPFGGLPGVGQRSNRHPREHGRLFDIGCDDTRPPDEFGGERSDRIGVEQRLSATLIATVAGYPDSSAATIAIRIAAVVFVAALTAAAAQVSVAWPFTPIPFTFQPMIVLLGGVVLGPRLGLSAALLYLAAGA